MFVLSCPNESAPLYSIDWTQLVTDKIVFKPCLIQGLERFQVTRWVEKTISSLGKNGTGGGNRREQYFCDQKQVWTGGTECRVIWGRRDRVVGTGRRQKQKLIDVGGPRRCSIALSTTTNIDCKHVWLHVVPAGASHTWRLIWLTVYHIYMCGYWIIGFPICRK